jgi:hypothetical protein
MDLAQKLEKNLTQITERYTFYVNYILTSIQEEGVSVDAVRSFVMGMTAFQSGSKEQCMLLIGIKTELNEAGTINKIFDLLVCNCASFINCRVFQLLAKRFGVKESDDEIMNYPEHLEAYVNLHKISEFIKINPALKEYRAEFGAELVLKFNIDPTCKLARINDLQAAVAVILDLQASTLQLVDITEGCVVVTFLIPTEVADIIFVDDKLQKILKTSKPRQFNG